MLIWGADNRQRDRLHGKPDPTQVVNTAELGDRAPNFRQVSLRCCVEQLLSCLVAHQIHAVERRPHGYTRLVPNVSDAVFTTWARAVASLVVSLVVP